MQLNLAVYILLACLLQSFSSAFPVQCSFDVNNNYNHSNDLNFLPSPGQQHLNNNHAPEDDALEVFSIGEKNSGITRGNGRITLQRISAPLFPTNTDGTLNQTQYIRDWYDDFDNGFNASNWIIQNGTWKGAISSSANVLVNNGTLQLMLNYNNATGIFQQGRVQSSAFFYEGYFEARILTTGGNGAHPAFWLAPLNVYPPPFYNQELDIWESNTYNPQYFTTTYHSWTNGTEYVRRNLDILFWRYNFALTNVKMNESFNVMACDWSRNNISLYWNGVLISTLPNPGYIWQNPLQVVFSQALQPWVDPRFPSQIKESPASFQIDYIAHYRRQQQHLSTITQTKTQSYSNGALACTFRPTVLFIVLFYCLYKGLTSSLSW